MSNSTRHFGKDVPLDMQRVQSFFDERGRRYSAETPYTSILYQDKNPEIAEARDAYEKAYVLPLFGDAATGRILDVGCGIGRWGDLLAGRAQRYVGIDLSAELINIARQRLPHAVFHVLPADQVSAPELSAEAPFDLAIISGLLLYMNDEAVITCLSALAPLMASTGQIYIREPLAVEQRMTLKEHWSEELGADYHAIYRTRDELARLVNTALAPHHFESCSWQPLYEDASLNNRSETRQYIAMLSRGSQP